jgi:hypothetical protein
MTTLAMVGCKAAMLGMMLCNPPSNTEQCQKAQEQYLSAERDVAEAGGEPAQWAGELLAARWTAVASECQ